MILSMRSYNEPVASENTCIVSFDLFFFFFELKNHDDWSSSPSSSTFSWPLRFRTRS